MMVWVSVLILWGCMVMLWRGCCVSDDCDGCWGVVRGYSLVLFGRVVWC